MSVFITVFSGVLVFVIGQIVVKLIIEPINDFKKERSKIIYDLVFYANKLANPKGPLVGTGISGWFLRMNA